VQISGQKPTLSLQQFGFLPPIRIQKSEIIFPKKEGAGVSGKKSAD